MTIDITFNVYSDANGGDPDSTSSTLRRYHKLLWSKPLPNGRVFELTDNHIGAYLYHKNDEGEYFLGSDAITHSYKYHKRKSWLIDQIPDDVNELFDTGSTIGAYILFPNNRVDGMHTINQARGVDGLIDDRFDLTLECIRRYYLGQTSPLYDTFVRYEGFFKLFVDFDGYVRFFLLDDLVDSDHGVKYYLPFDDFRTRPVFADKYAYLQYKTGVMDFIKSRNSRIEAYSSKWI
jgi:hypothetical protein